MDAPHPEIYEQYKLNLVSYYLKKSDTGVRGWEVGGKGVLKRVGEEWKENVIKILRMKISNHDFWVKCEYISVVWKNCLANL